MCILKWNFFSYFKRVRSTLVMSTVGPSVRPSVRTEQLCCCHWTDFDEFWYSSIFRKSVEKHTLRICNTYCFSTATMLARTPLIVNVIQGGSNMIGTDLCVNKPQSVPVIFEPPCTYIVSVGSCGSNFKGPSQVWNNYRCVFRLTLILLTWRIWWAPSNASKWQIGFNPAFKRLKMKNAVNGTILCVLLNQG